MAQQLIGIGATANDGTGDQLRDAFDKVNDNDTELYTASGTNTTDIATNTAALVDINAGDGTVVRVTAPATLKGVSGDTAGMIAHDADSVYVCVTTWTDGVADIWIQVNTDATIDHTAITNVGTNSHTAIDTHIADATIHGLTINDQTTAAYELVLTDANKLVRVANGGANTLTIPANASVAFPIGTVIQINMAGAGVTTIGITTDTLNGVAGITTMAQWEVVTLTKVNTTEWLAS